MKAGEALKGQQAPLDCSHSAQNGRGMPPQPPPLDANGLPHLPGLGVEFHTLSADIAFSQVGLPFLQSEVSGLGGMQGPSDMRDMHWCQGCCKIAWLS